MKSNSSASIHSDDEIANEEKDDLANSPQALEATSKGKVKGSLFLQYLQAGAHSTVLFLLFVLFLTAQILASGADYFVAFWYGLFSLVTLFFPLLKVVYCLQDTTRGTSHILCT